MARCGLGSSVGVKELSLPLQTEPPVCRATLGVNPKGAFTAQPGGMQLNNQTPQADSHRGATGLQIPPDSDVFHTLRCVSLVYITKI